MKEPSLGPIGIDVGEYHLLVDTELPTLFNQYVERAGFVDTIHLEAADGASFFVAVHNTGDWPEVVIALRYQPAGYGFTPGVLFVPETKVLFLGAGTTLLSYALDGTCRRLWIDEAELGFWRWKRSGNRVVMSAELELAVWDITGEKLWTTFVEPPWSYHVDGSSIRLDVMGTISKFPIDTGPNWTKLPWL